MKMVKQANSAKGSAKNGISIQNTSSLTTKGQTRIRILKGLGSPLARQVSLLFAVIHTLFTVIYVCFSLLMCVFHFV